MFVNAHRKGFDMLLLISIILLQALCILVIYMATGGNPAMDIVVLGRSLRGMLGLGDAQR